MSLHSQPSTPLNHGSSSVRVETARRAAKANDDDENLFSAPLRRVAFANGFASTVLRGIIDFATHEMHLDLVVLNTVDDGASDAVSRARERS